MIVFILVVFVIVVLVYIVKQSITVEVYKSFFTSKARQQTDQAILGARCLCSKVKAPKSQITAIAINEVYIL